MTLPSGMDTFLFSFARLCLCACDVWPVCARSVLLIEANHGLTSHTTLPHSSGNVAAQAQLRGLIGDYQDSDEDALAKGLEAFETVNRVVDDHEEATSPRAPQEAPAQVSSACPAVSSMRLCSASSRP